MSYASLSDVEDAFFPVVMSVLGGAISGSVYHDGTRPIDSQLEDVVIKASSGTAKQIQDFSVYVNVYVPDIRNKTSHFVKNRGRLEEIEAYEDELIMAFNEANSGLYETELLSATMQMKVHEVQQHFVSFNFKVNCLTFNIE